MCCVPCSTCAQPYPNWETGLVPCSRLSGAQGCPPFLLYDQEPTAPTVYETLITELRFTQSQPVPVPTSPAKTRPQNNGSTPLPWPPSNLPRRIGCEAAVRVTELPVASPQTPLLPLRRHNRLGFQKHRPHLPHTGIQAPPGPTSAPACKQGSIPVYNVRVQV